MADVPGGSDGGATPGERDFERSYDVGESERPSEAVVRAVATLSNRRPIDLAPLYEVVDPVHLDGLFEARGPGGGVEGCSVTFRFEGYHVSVSRDTVSVRADDRSEG